jgi:hypothetical protein
MAARGVGNNMALPTKIILAISSAAFKKFLDMYGEEIIAYASRRGEEVVRTYGPPAARWTAAKGSELYSAVAPRAGSAISRLSAVSGRSAKGAVIPSEDETDDGRLSLLLFGSLAGSLAVIGAYVRAAAAVGREQLGNVSDEQIGAVAVALWRMQNRNTFLGRRVRRLIWRGQEIENAKQKT